MAFKLSTGLIDAMLGVGSFKDTMAHGVLYIFSGVQPTDADATETQGAVLLNKITLSSGAFVSGVNTNGLVWDTPAAKVINKPTGDVWSGVGIADGQAGWFRFYGNTVVSGASITAIRFDGRITLPNGGGEMVLSSLTIATGASTIIRNSSFTLAIGG
jgi:hypothetical protein